MNFDLFPKSTTISAYLYVINLLFPLIQASENPVDIITAIPVILAFDDDLKIDDLGAESTERVVEADLEVPRLVHRRPVRRIRFPEIGYHWNA